MFELDHVTNLFVAVDGVIVAIKVAVPPTATATDDGAMLMPVTNTNGAGTIIVTVADLPEPSAAFAVIVAVPGAFPVTIPVLDTVATDVLLDDHVTDLFAAFDGNTDAVNVIVPPTVTDVDVAVIDTDDTRIGFTVTVEVADLPEPSAALAVIVAVPGALPVTTPVLDTVATDALFDDHVTDLLLAFDGDTAADNDTVPPTLMVACAGDTEIPVTGCSMAVTVTVPPNVVLALSNRNVMGDDGLWPKVDGNVTVPADELTVTAA